jgi:hypothetical protein
MPTDTSWRKTRAQVLKLNVVETSAERLIVDQQLVTTESNLIIEQITGDGNCFYRAISKEVTGDEGYHDNIRRAILHLMIDNRFSVTFARYAGVSSIEEYISEKRVNVTGTWATDVEIFAAASLLNTTIVIHTLVGKETKWLPYRPLVIVPEGPPPTDRCVYLTNYSNHYNRVINRVMSGVCM